MANLLEATWGKAGSVQALPEHLSVARGLNLGPGDGKQRVKLGPQTHGRNPCSCRGGYRPEALGFGARGWWKQQLLAQGPGGQQSSPGAP